jgi:hypothetical protein
VAGAGHPTSYTCRALCVGVHDIAAYLITSPAMTTVPAGSGRVTRPGFGALGRLDTPAGPGAGETVRRRQPRRHGRGVRRVHPRAPRSDTPDPV